MATAPGRSRPGWRSRACLHARWPRRSDVRQLRRPGDHVADGVDAFGVGAHVLVGDHEAAPSITTPVPSPRRPSVRGRRPTDTTIMSTSTSPPSPRARTVPPPCFGCGPDCAPVMTSMPRFLNERRPPQSRRGRSPPGWSGGLDDGHREPRSESSEANSHPMAPPPTTAALAGTCSSQELVGGEHQAPVDVETGEGAGTEPAASTMLRRDLGAGVVAVDHPHPVTGRRCVAENVVTSGPSGGPRDPCRAPRRRRLAGLAHGEVEARLLVVMPNSPAPETERQTAAVSRNSLAGTQPRCRQVPPTLSRSTIATDSPGRRRRGGRVPAGTTADHDDVELGCDRVIAPIPSLPSPAATGASGWRR